MLCARLCSSLAAPNLLGVDWPYTIRIIECHRGYYKSIKSKKWEKIKLDIWRGKEGVEKISTLESYDDKFYLVKEEVTHYGDKKLILKSKSDGKIIEKIIKD